MKITIALAGNPNSGKSTLFNALTGSNQYVGNWPGVTVEKKTGLYKKEKDVAITDLPGIYSLSPYTLEEVVSRDYLINEKVDVIIDVVDGTNIERNLYLATQLSELGIPLVIALNMMDVVRKNKDYIDVAQIEKRLGCKVVEISALKGENIDHLVEVAKSFKGQKTEEMKTFGEDVEKYLTEIEEAVASIKEHKSKRWIAIKLFENDEKIRKEIKISAEEGKKVDEIIARAEKEMGDDGEGIITDERYNYVAQVTRDTVKKTRTGMTKSDKIDKIVTNRFLAIPIFVVVMTLIYLVAVKFVGGPVNDWWADKVLGETIPGFLDEFLSTHGASPMVSSLLANGIVGGVGAVLGYLPVIATIFLLVSILEDVGYMARIAFILDRIFRKFGLSGKSFIPILIGTGCSIPGIMGTRTIENENDRKMTITVASFMPCGAKTEIIAMFGAILGGVWWYAPLWYFAGILAVIISGVILKKTSRFQGDPAPFVMELPEYHAPSLSNVGKATLHRCKAFIIKAGTLILLCSLVIWALSSFTTSGQFIDFNEDAQESILSFVGNKIKFLFAPLGFGDWMATVATFFGLAAKEVVVGTYGVVSGIGADADADSLKDVILTNFNTVSMFSFILFNQLTLPCFGALGAIKEEMGSSKWFRFALIYQLCFSYSIAFMVYQIGSVLVLKTGFNIETAIACVILVVYMYLLFRPNKYRKGSLEPNYSVK
ncbi:ferrous iron transport protein B [Peptoniphilus duerdenii]|uniref:Ferrous iron transport protein B n=1 Tax=Peptoniphilus duerdenii ATCC BAA-1640 TaxID=862517 RepID=E0NKH9_9FIRM|nr:ferrous iron transport protein B [Peptoniphilus duerdenii]EFM25702.1 ferrous iron transport protein B [Peptoniphilus duerdenii ATCC BAA-1640]MDK8276153.1 ferrous iron transport protein B [Peptoniphilus duerdenii]